MNPQKLVPNNWWITVFIVLKILKNNKLVTWLTKQSSNSTLYPTVFLLYLFTSFLSRLRSIRIIATEDVHIWHAFSCQEFVVK